MYHQSRAVKLVFWMLSTLLAWQTALPYAAVTQAAESAKPVQQVVSDAPNLVGAGVSTYSMTGSTIFWADGCSKGQAPVSINRIYAGGGTPRRLYEAADCAAIASNPAADATHVYWISRAGLTRVSRNANVGDTPSVISTIVRAPANPPSPITRRMQIVLTTDYILALTDEGSSRVLYRVAKSNGATVELVRSTSSYIYDVSLGEDGIYYYRLSGNANPLFASSLRQGNYNDIQAAHLLIGDGVTAYYVDPAFFAPTGCNVLSSFCHETEIFIARSDRIELFVPKTGSRTLDYVSPIAGSVIHWIGGTERGGPRPTTYFFERRMIDLGNGNADYEFLLMAHTPLSFPLGPRILNRIVVPADVFLLLWPQNLVVKDKFLFWEFDDRLQQLPTNTAALPQQNLRILDLEVTQGVQYRDNRIPLIANRRTFVRMHVKADSSDAADIRAELLSDRSTQPLLPVNRDAATGNPLVGLTVPVSPVRNDINHSFLFELPADWLNGNLRLTARLNLASPPRLPIEPTLNDNTRVVDVQFKGSPYLPVVFFPVSYLLGVNQSPAPEDLPRMISQVNRMYPLADTVNPAQTGQGLHADVRPTVEISGFGLYVSQQADDCLDMPVEERNQCATKALHSWLNVQRFLNNMNTVIGGIADPLYYAAPAPAPPFWIRGQAKPKKRTGVSPSNEPETAAHEIGHLIGRDHPAMCGAGPDDGDNDMNFPYIHPAHLGPDPRNMTPPEDVTNGGVMGLDMGDPSLNLPVTTKQWNAHSDLMSYCTNLFAPWFSDYTYTGLYDGMRAMFGGARTPAAVPQNGDFLFVDGTVVSDGSKAIVHHARRASTVYGIPPRVPGPYSIELRNAQNAVLASYPFTPEEHAHAPARQAASQHMQSFNQIVPFVAGTTSIKIVRVADKVVIDSVAISANAPVVSNVALVNPPSPVAGKVTLSWAASDADLNTSLRYDVLISRDAGTTFQPLKGALTTKSTVIDADALGGGAAIFRVVATDGVLTASKDSVAYTLKAKPPTVRITSASGSVKLVYGQNINLIGQARDLQDGYVADNNLVWTDQNGKLYGRGTTLALKLLPAGTTSMTLTATNSAGLSASTSVDLVVDDRVEPSGATLTVAPAQVRWVVKPGATLQRIPLVIGNAGTGSIGWTASAAADWLRVTPSSGNGPATVTLSGDPAGLGAGATLATTLYVRTLDGTQSIAVPVSLHVEGPQVDGPQLPITPVPFVVGTGTPASCTATALEATLKATQGVGKARITFACGDAPHTIVLPRTLPVLSDVIVDGGNRVTLDGNKLVRHFELCLPNSNGAADVELALAGLTLANGKSDPNRAGGSITNYGCRLVVSHTRFVGNTAVFEAGAINNLADGSATIVDSAFVDNRAATIGGAIVMQAGHLTVRNTLFRNNAANGGNGGAIFAYDPAPVTIRGSTFERNHATSRGGAVSSGAATFISNSTFADNTAALGGAAVRRHIDAGMTELVHVTITGDAGLALSGGMTLRNSIVHNRTGAPNCEGTMTHSGSNLEFPGTSCGANIQNRDPLLAALGNNGGSTPTSAIDAASPARDAGDNAVCATVGNIDQRGAGRPQGSRCDIGAFEHGAVAPPSSSVSVVATRTTR